MVSISNEGRKKKRKQRLLKLGSKSRDVFITHVTMFRRSIDIHILRDTFSFRLGNDLLLNFTIAI